MAEANLQVKMHNVLIEQRTLGPNQYDLIGQMRAHRLQKTGDISKVPATVSSQSLHGKKTTAGSSENLRKMTAASGFNDNSRRDFGMTGQPDHYGGVETWQPRNGTPGDLQVVKFH